MCAMSQMGVLAPRAFRDLAARLKKYELLGLLGSGGMAQLFLARTQSLDGSGTLLAIKRIVPALAGDAQSVLMFLDEARIASTLQHPNIVRAYDVDVVDGELFLAMEYLHGHDATALLRRAQSRGLLIPLENAVAVAVAVAAGLHYAHEKRGGDGRPLGIVHRDISPDNVILTYEGNVKIIDFGIAKAATNLARTTLGVFKGKVAYASPEQCHCEQVDRRSDVFSLGALLFELSTGRVLFSRDNELAVMKAITEEPIPRPSDILLAYPSALERVVLRALARKRSDRYATAQELQRDLECVAREHRLDLSPSSLVRLLETLFRDDLDAWQAAQHAGAALEQHIVRSRAMGPVEAAGDPDRGGGADGNPEPAPLEPPDRNRLDAAELATTAPGRRPSSLPPKRQKARTRRWVVTGLAVCFLAVGGAAAAHRFLSPGSARSLDPRPSPNGPPAGADKLLRNAEMYKAIFVREAAEPPCLPPSCAKATGFKLPEPCESALYYYRLYLEVSPEVINRAEIEAVVEDLEGRCP